MGIDMHSQLRHLSTYFILSLILCIAILFWSSIVMAGPGQKPGDCTACHADVAKVLPETHPDTKGMTMMQCQMCHGQGKISLSDKFLAIHKQMLSGDPQKSKAPETPGKETEVKAGSAPGKASDAKTPAASGKAAPAKAAGIAPNCTACHSKPEYGKYFSQTKHAALQCSVCHKGVTEISKHMRGAEPVETASCLTCHKDIQKQGFHATVKKFSCAQCHAGIHPREAPAPKILKPKAAPAPQGPALSIADCTSCHSGPKYEKPFAQTFHGKLSCTVCHSGITDLALHMKKQQKPALTSCGVCHQDIEKKYSKSFHAVKAKLSCLQLPHRYPPRRGREGRERQGLGDRCLPEVPQRQGQVRDEGACGEGPGGKQGCRFVQ